MSHSSTFLNSVGIDIGTTTTQVIFSRLTIANTLPQHLAPKLEIVDRKILYRGKIHFTPLLDSSTLDAQGVMSLINQEFQRAGLKKTEIHTGAVIITGQSVKKNNAREIVHSLAELTGNFVVATAGPHIESFLAGRGSGAAARSKQKGRVIANIDIGGGTSNIAVFKDGYPIDSCCLNIGGRLLKVNPDGFITYLAENLSPFLKKMGLNLRTGEQALREELQRLSEALALILRDSLFEPAKEDVKYFLVTPGLKLNYQIDEITCSGGVADYIYQSGKPESLAQILRFGDLGPLLGTAIRDAFQAWSLPVTKPAETIRATVTGAGIQSLRLSGSTILVNPQLLPLKNIPVIKINDLSARQAISRIIKTVLAETQPAGLALSLTTISLNSFANIYDTGQQIKEIIGVIPDKNMPIIIVAENDCALVLGQTMGTITANPKIMCIDQVSVDEGDYIDIGSPIDGQGVPVVIKTLLFD